MEKEKITINWEENFVHHRTASAVKRAEFVSNRVSHTSTVLKSHWCNIIVSNVRAPSLEETDDSKGSFYEKLEHIGHFPKYHINILLGDFNAKMGRENIFKPTAGLH